MKASPIRLIVDEDVPAVREIYRPFVEHTHTSFEYELPSVTDFSTRVARTLTRYPWLVYISAGQVVGYAYATAHRGRSAYQWSVESSVYTHADFRQRGVGRALYQVLFAILRLQGFYHVYAGIGLPNPASIAFHQAFGFRPVGVYEQIGYKAGRWVSNSWWQLALQALPDPPPPPVWLPHLPRNAAWKKALQAT